MQSIPIVPLGEANLDAAANILSRAYSAPPWNEDWSAEAATERVSQLLAAPRRIAAAALDAAVQPVGFAIGTWRRHHKGQLLYVEEIAVLPEAQGVGVGTALLAAITDAARKAGCERIWLVSQRVGKVSDFYRRNGFVTSDHLDVYTKMS